MDHVMIVNNVAALAVGKRSSASQRHHRCRAKKAFEAIVVEMDAQTMTDQARGGAVEDTTQDKAAARCRRNSNLLIIGCPSLRKLSETWSFQIDALSIAGIAPSHDLVDKS